MRGPRTIAVSVGKTVLSICSTSACANSAHIASSSAGPCAKKDLRNAPVSRTRGPFPGSYMNGVCGSTSGTRRPESTAVTGSTVSLTCSSAGSMSRIWIGECRLWPSNSTRRAGLGSPDASVAPELAVLVRFDSTDPSAPSARDFLVGESFCCLPADFRGFRFVFDGPGIVGRVEECRSGELCRRGQMNRGKPTAI